MSSDILFSTIENFHLGRPWGRLLDAGTGLHSLKWIQNLDTTSFTAITADINMKNQILRDSSVVEKLAARNARQIVPPLPLVPADGSSTDLGSISVKYEDTSTSSSSGRSDASNSECDNIVVGNWMDDEFCSTLGTYDTILADYLIGAVDGFSPYEQDVVLTRLKVHLKPGGRLYFIGMQPIPDHAKESDFPLPTAPARSGENIILQSSYSQSNADADNGGVFASLVNTSVIGAALSIVGEVLTGSGSSSSSGSSGTGSGVVVGTAGVGEDHNMNYHAAELVTEVRRVRDACILLAGHRPYREFPLTWMRRHLEQSGLQVVGNRNFTIMHSSESICRQIKVAQSKLPLMSATVRIGLEKHLAHLEARVKEVVPKLEKQRVPLSFDYILAVEHSQ